VSGEKNATTVDGVWSRESLLAIIGAALKAGDMEAAALGIKLLAVTSPHDAGLILAVLDSIAREAS